MNLSTIDRSHWTSGVKTYIQGSSSLLKLVKTIPCLAHFVFYKVTKVDLSIGLPRLLHHPVNQHTRFHDHSTIASHKCHSGGRVCVQLLPRTLHSNKSIPSSLLHINTTSIERNSSTYTSFAPRQYFVIKYTPCCYPCPHTFWKFIFFQKC